MSAESTAAATILDTEIAAIDSSIASYDAEITTHAGVLTNGQRNGAVAFWTDHATRAGSLLPLAAMLYLSTNPLDVNMRATRWMALRAERRLQQQRRQALADYAAQCRNGDQIHGRVPPGWTAQQIADWCLDTARDYMISSGNDEVAVELLGRKITR